MYQGIPFCIYPFRNIHSPWKKIFIAGAIPSHGKNIPRGYLGNLSAKISYPSTGLAHSALTLTRPCLGQSGGKPPTACANFSSRSVGRGLAQARPLCPGDRCRPATLDLATSFLRFFLSPAILARAVDYGVRRHVSAFCRTFFLGRWPVQLRISTPDR